MILGLAAAIVAGAAAPAAATSGPRRLQRLAVAQTQLLFRYYHGQPQIVSPARCNAHPDAETYSGVFLLPTLTFSSGNATVRCRITTRTVLVDLGGLIPTEDARKDSYPLAGGTVLYFRRQNLQAICNDAARYLPDTTATLDNQPFTGTLVITRNFTEQIHRGANNTPGNPYYEDSKRLGHPGQLTSCYVGKKALLHLSPGSHVISVDLSALTGTPTQLTYLIDVAGD